MRLAEGSLTRLHRHRTDLPIVGWDMTRQREDSPERRFHFDKTASHDQRIKTHNHSSVWIGHTWQAITHHYFVPNIMFFTTRVVYFVSTKWVLQPSRVWIAQGHMPQQRTATSLNCHTNTQIHKYTQWQLHNYTMTQMHVSGCKIAGSHTSAENCDLCNCDTGHSLLMEIFKLLICPV